MSVTINAKGTSVSFFTIGKKGTTYYQGTVDPTGSYTVLNSDYWFDTSANSIKVRSSGSWWAPSLGPFVFPATTGTTGQVLITDGTGVLSFSSAGSGTVTSVSVTTANGVSGTVATSTTTPAITLTLGAITPTTVNGLVVGMGNFASTSNTALGLTVLNANTSGTNNTGVGYQSLLLDVSGNDNTGVGYQALRNVTGAGNTALGSGAGQALGSVTGNVLIGQLAGVGITGGSYNVGVGYVALRYSSQGSNTAVGGYSMQGDSGGSSGTQNVALGYQTLKAYTTASRTVAIGYNTLTANTTSTDNTAIGNSAFSTNTTSVSGGTVVGSLSDCLSGATGGGAIGYSSQTEMPGEYTFGFSDQFDGTTTTTTTKSSILTYAATTTNATPTEIGNAGITATTTPTNRIVLTNNSTYIFDCDVVARKSTGGTDYSAWNVKFCINREANAASTALVGTVATTLIGQTAGATSGTWDVTVTADTTNGRPNISVKGQTSTTIRWSINIRMTKVGG